MLESHMSQSKSAFQLRLLAPFKKSDASASSKHLRISSIVYDFKRADIAFFRFSEIFVTAGKEIQI